MAEGFVTYGYAYFLLYPKFECFKNGELIPQDSDDYEKYCTPSYFCNKRESDVNLDVWMNPVSTSTLRNWIIDFDLLCASHLEISFFAMSAFIGLSIAFFILPRMQDIYGRKIIFNISIAAILSTLYAFLVVP